MSKRLNKLLAKRGELSDALTAKLKLLDGLVAKAEQDGERDLDDAERKEFDAHRASIAELKAAIDKLDGELAEEREIEAARRASATPIRDALAPPPARAKRHYGPLKSFKGPTAEDDAFASGQFIFATLFGNKAAAAWCQEHGIEIRAHNEGSNTAGGYLVPTQMETAIIDLREQYGTFRGYVPQIPMASDRVTIPRRTGGLTGYFVDEGVQPTESEKTWGQVMLTAKKMAILTRMSTELAEDAVINIADDLASEIAYAFAKKEDDCGWNGDGTSTYGGIIGVKQKFVAGLSTYKGAVDGAAGHDTFAEMDSTDIANVMAALPKYAEANAAWYVSQPGWSLVFQRLAQTSGTPMSEIVGTKPQRQYLGYPVIIDQTLPTTTGDLSDVPMLYFGNLGLAAKMGQRRGVTIRTLNERYAELDQIGIFASERFDIVVHDVGDATNAGPLIALMGE